MAYMVPNFLMGQGVQADFAPIQNALAQYHKNQQFNANKALEEARLGESVRQFDAQNALAQRRFGLDERAAGRADQMAPLQMQLLRAQAQEAQSGIGMAPIRMDLLKAQAEQARAAAKAAAQKDQINEALGGMIRNMMPGSAPQGSGPTLQPQSFGGGNVDPMLIPTQTAGGPPMANQPEMVDTPAGRMTMEQAQKFGFALGLAGKGDAGKLFTEAANANKLSKEARNKVDEQELNAVNAVGRLKQIASGYQDKWLTIENKVKQLGLSWMDSFETLRSKMKPEDIKDLEEYTLFKRDAIENLTMGIKDATGAAMGVQEERRIRAGMPDPEKDSPREFKAKLFGSVRAYELAVQRTQFLRQNGFRGDANAAAVRMPIERFDNLLKDSRGLYQRLKTENPAVDDGAIRNEVRRQIRQKYGIDT